MKSSLNIYMTIETLDLKAPMHADFEQVLAVLRSESQF